MTDLNPWAAGAAIISAASAVYSAVIATRASKAQKRADAELAAIRHRHSAPFLKFFDFECYDLNNKNRLPAQRLEELVLLAESTRINLRMFMRNDGMDVREIKFSAEANLTLQTRTSRRGVDCFVLDVDYGPAEFMKAFKVYVAFEAADAYQANHIYTCNPTYAIFERIDPPLPKLEK